MKEWEASITIEAAIIMSMAMLLFFVIMKLGLQLYDETRTLIVENNAKAEEIIPKINASIDSIKDLIENINEMNEKVATIALI